MRVMRRWLVLASLLLLSVASVAQSREIVRLTIDGPITPITEEHVARAIDHADAVHAPAVLIVMRTPGGLMDSMQKIVARILASKSPVIIYVSPSGNWAASAGFFILESADVAAMAPGSNTGAAHPIFSNGAKMDDVVKEKMENNASAFLRSYCHQRGRNVEVAETAVRGSKSWTSDEALQLKLIDFIAKDEASLLYQLDGREITRFDGRKQTLHLAGLASVEYPTSLRERVLEWLMDPNVAFIILALGALCIYFEFNHPGAILPGAVGFVCVMLALFALNLLPIRYAALVMILSAFIAFALEAKFVTHGLLTLVGIVLITFGGVFLIDAPIPELSVKWITAFSVALPLGAITSFLMTIALRARRNKRVNGWEGMIGLVGEALTDISESGQVFVHGEHWTARSRTPIAAGASVRVLSLEGFLLEVEPVDKISPSSQKSE